MSHAFTSRLHFHIAPHIELKPSCHIVNVNLMVSLCVSVSRSREMLRNWRTFLWESTMYSRLVWGQNRTRVLPRSGRGWDCSMGHPKQGAVRMRLFLLRRGRSLQRWVSIMNWHLTLFGIHKSFSQIHGNIRYVFARDKYCSGQCYYYISIHFPPTSFRQWEVLL